MRAFGFEHRSGFGVVAGVASGGLVCWDFDNVETAHAFNDVAPRCGLGHVVETIRQGFEVATPRSGRRWLYRLPDTEEFQDRTLARRPHGKKADVLIELTTFSVLAPSNGRVHPSGKPYVQLSGTFDSIANVTAEEHIGLVELARSFDEMPRRQHAPAKPVKATPGADRPGDDYNVRVSWLEILESHGWAHVFERGDVSYWRRPGKPVGISATTGYGGSDLFYPFTSSTEFEPETSYT